MTVRYYTTRTLDPYSGDVLHATLEDARKAAVGVGHCVVHEYEVIPGRPGRYPESEEIVANHFLHRYGGEWVREPVEVPA